MSTAQTAAAIVTAAVPLLVALASLLCWAYKRGEAAGEDRARRVADERVQVEAEAKIRALERVTEEILRELSSRSKRTRVMRLSG
jgi:O-phosphoseryl-tRNA(Cys) synthetase